MSTRGPVHTNEEVWALIEKGRFDTGPGGGKVCNRWVLGEFLDAPIKAVLTTTTETKLKVLHCVDGIDLEIGWLTIGEDVHTFVPTGWTPATEIKPSPHKNIIALEAWKVYYQEVVTSSDAGVKAAAESSDR